MARREGGRGRRVIPGLSAALAAYNRRFDSKFCMRAFGDECGWCARVAAYEAGRPVETRGSTIWSALFDERQPREWGEFMRDETAYVVTADRLERA